MTKQAKKTTIQVTMLGGLRLQAGNTIISDDADRSHKIWNLLSYLILHRHRNVPQGELVDMLWPDEGSDNPTNALKTLLYRVRATIAPLFGEEAQLIISRRGCYCWNEEYPCSVDAERFAALVAEAGGSSLDLTERKDLYKQAAALYTQDFLPKLANQLWVVPIATYYHSLYVQAVCDYGKLLLDGEQYAELAELCAAATRVEPYHERLHALLIIALLRQGNNSTALNHYEAATELIYRHLGVRPSEELLSLYAEIMKGQRDLELDLDVILKDLREIPDRRGAFVCDYGFFRQVYRIEARRAERQGTCLHVALLTLTSPDGKGLEPIQQDHAMSQLLQAVLQTLRLGDVVARYSSAQYALMLPSASYEDGMMVMERIMNAFYRSGRHNRLKLSYKLKPLETGVEAL